MAYYGYLGNDKNYSSELSRRNKALTAYYEKMAEEDAIKEEQRKNDEIVKQQQANSVASGKNADGSEKDIWAKAGDLAAGAGGLIKDMAVDAYKTGENAIKSNTSVLQGQAASNKMARNADELNRAVKEQDAFMSKLQEADYDRPEIKAKLSEYEKRKQEIMGRTTADDKRQLTESYAVDTTKAAADTAETFLNVATLGSGTMLTQGGKMAAKAGVKALAKAGAKDLAKTAGTKMAAAGLNKMITKGAAKQASRGIVGKTFAGAGEGSIYGGAAGLTNSVSEGRTPEEMVGDTLQGAVFGGVLGGGSSAAFAGAGKGIKTLKNNADFNKNVKGTASSVFNDTKSNGGSTYAIDGTRQEAGFAYSPFKDAEKIIDADKFKPKDVEDYIKAHKKELSDPNNRVGTWESEGKVYLDISRVADDVDAAIADAAANKQLAIYDISTGNEIPVGVMDSANNYTQTNKGPAALAAEQANAPKQLGAGFKDNASYDAELQRYQNMEFTPEDNVWKDRTVAMEDGTTVDLNAIDTELHKNNVAIRDLEQQATGKDLAGNDAMDMNPGANPAEYTGDIEGRTRAMEKIDELKARNQELQATRDTAATMTDAGEMALDPIKIRESFANLSAEAKAAREYNYNVNGRDPQTIRADIDNLDNGRYPDDIVEGVKRHNTAEEILDNEKLPEEFVKVADEVATDKAYMKEQLANLNTPESVDAEKFALSQDYQAQKATLDGLDEVQQKYELDKLTAEYEDELFRLDDALMNDAEKVNTLMDAMENLNVREKEVVQAANWHMVNNADEFSNANPELVAQRKAQLEVELNEAEAFTKPARIAETVVESGEDLVQKADTDGGVKQAVASEVENALENAKIGDPIFGMAFRSPSVLFEKMGLKPMFNDVTRAYEKTIQATMADMKQIGAIGKLLDDEAIDGQDIIKYVRGESNDIPAASKEVSDMVKAFFDEKRGVMESMGYKGIDNYFPEYIDKSDPNFQRLFTNKENGEIGFGSFKHREGNLGDFNKDIVDVMRIYSQGFNKKVHFEPSLKQIESIKNSDKAHGVVKNWVNDYLQQLKGTTEPSAIEQGFNHAIDKALGTNKFTSGMVGGSHYRTTLADARMYTSVATMGLNPATAMRNLTQSVNTMAEFGSVNSFKGMVEGTKALLSGIKNRDSPAWREIRDAGVIDGGVARNYADELDKILFSQGKWKGGKVKAVDGMMAMIRWTDISLRAQAYYAAKAAGKAKGLTGKELMDYAQSGAIKTQFNTTRLDMPTNLNGPGVRSLTQLATFSIKQTEFLAEMGIKTFKDPATGKFKIVPNKENVGRLIQATAMGAGFTSVLGPLMGFQADEFNPWNQQTGSDSASGALYRSPLVKLAIGDGKGKIGLFDVLNMNDDKTAGDASKEFWDDNWNMLIPGGSQLKKSGEGFDLATTGDSENAKGQTKFLHDNGDGFDNIKALLFGQYATKGGRQWLKDGMPTMTDSETKQMSGLSKDKKEQYYDYYVSAKQDVSTTFAKGRSEAVEKIKAAAVNNEPLARQMAAEYNQKVDTNMGRYWSKHQDMPERLKDEMFNELRIDVAKQIESANKEPSLTSMQKANAYGMDDMR